VFSLSDKFHHRKHVCVFFSLFFLYGQVYIMLVWKGVFVHLYCMSRWTEWNSLTWKTWINGCSNFCISATLLEKLKNLQTRCINIYCLLIHLFSTQSQLYFFLPVVFSKDFYCRQVKTRAWFGKGLIGEGVLLNFNCKENRWFQSYFTKYVWTQPRPIRLSKRNSFFFRSAHGELLWSCCVRRLSCIVNFLPCVRLEATFFS
jgi:hypothetical protein